MKPSISKETKALLASLEGKDEKEINFFRTNDPIDELIFGNGLYIKALHFHPELDLWLIVLNNGKILERKLSAFKQLSAAKNDQLLNFRLLGNGAGIHWPGLDEDISLRGLMEEEVTRFSRSMFG